MFFEIALVLLVVPLTFCDREHKVHNIVLYPERHSWCQTTPIKQEVASPGYESVTIDNNVCVGACYSYSIPSTKPAEPGEVIGPYCDSCQPVRTRCYHVTLKADDKSTDGPKTIQKRVQIITDCSCMTCETTQGKDCEVLDKDTAELPTDLFALIRPTLVNLRPSLANLHPSVLAKIHPSLFNLGVHLSNTSVVEAKPAVPEEIPELLNFAPRNTTSDLKFNITNATREERFQLNSKLIALLRSIQNEDDEPSNINYDRDELKQLLDIIEGSEHELSDKNLMEFVNFVNIHNSEDLELDLSKLKDVLVNFRKTQELEEKHRNFGLPIFDLGQQNNADIESDLLTLKKNDDFGIEGNHLGLRRVKGNHVGMGIVSDNELIDEEKPVLPKGHHHHLGEEQQLAGEGRGHLVRGPHGSFAFSPDFKIEKKLTIDADMLKPNHEGVVVEYENYPNIHKVEDLVTEHIGSVK